MLTVKHVSPSGNELVFPALEVAYNPHHFESAAVDGPSAPMGYVWYTPPTAPSDPRYGTPIHRLDNGTVYVMNEAGKTVSVYRLANGDPAPGAAAA